LPPGLEVVFNGERYDGCRPENGNLIEAKGEGYADKMSGPDSWKGWFTGFADLKQQMEYHSQYAGERMVEYYFAEPSVAAYFRKYAKRFPNVLVFYEPPMRNQ
jgi:hypothetical protein